MGQFDLTRTLFPKPQLGGDGGGRRRGGGGFSLLILEDQAAEIKGHQEHDQGPRRMEKGMRVFGPSAALASSLAGLAT